MGRWSGDQMRLWKSFGINLGSRDHHFNQPADEARQSLAQKCPRILLAGIWRPAWGAAESGQLTCARLAGGVAHMPRTSLATRRALGSSQFDLVGIEHIAWAAGANHPNFFADIQIGWTGCVNLPTRAIGRE